MASPTTEQRSTSMTTTKVQQPLVQRLQSITTTGGGKTDTEEKTNAGHKKLDEQAFILNGDFSTLVGTWRNGLKPKSLHIR